MAPERPDLHDTYYPRVAVAALDVLGINSLVGRKDKALAAMNVLSRFVRNASARGVYKGANLTDRHDQMYAVDLYFGDSLYLFADSSRDLDTQVQWLVVRLATLVGLGLWNIPRFLVRGAIAVGNLRRRITQTDGSRHEIRIGDSMTGAHLLQEAQDWVGAAVAAGAPLNVETAKWTNACPVPLKPSTTIDAAPVAINWVWSNGTLEQVRQEVLDAVRETGQEGQASTKVENTLEFARCVYTARQFAPFERPEG